MRSAGRSASTRADLDDRLARAPRRSARWVFSVRACSSAVIVRCLANERGWRQATSPRVQRDRGDLAVGDRGPRRGGRPARGRASSRRYRSAGYGSGGTLQHPAPVGVRRRWPAAAPSPRAPRSSRSIGRARSVLCIRGFARSVKPAVELQLVVAARCANAAPGLEAAFDEVLQALDDALGLRVAARRRSASRRAAARRTRRTRSVGRPAVACSPAWRSQTSVCGSAPSDHRQRRIPNSRSGVCLEKISAPAPARE